MTLSLLAPRLLQHHGALVALLFLSARVGGGDSARRGDGDGGGGADAELLLQRFDEFAQLQYRHALDGLDHLFLVHRHR